MISATGRYTGFTLLELLVTLAVLMLLTAAWPIAAPRLFPAQQLRNEAQRLVVALNAARNLARITNQPIEFHISVNPAAYGAENNQYYLPRGLDLASEPPSGTSTVAVIRFFPDGSSDGGNLILSRDQRRIEIHIGQMLGRPDVQT